MNYIPKKIKIPFKNIILCFKLILIKKINFKAFCIYIQNLYKWKFF